MMLHVWLRKEFELGVFKLSLSILSHFSFRMNEGGVMMAPPLDFLLRQVDSPLFLIDGFLISGLLSASLFALW
jgi:hypothetical protein